LLLGAALTALIVAASAGAANTIIRISGTTPFAACGATTPVTVPAPSTITTRVAASGSAKIYEQIVDRNGNVLASAESPSFTTSASGKFGVRVCSYGDPQDENSPMHYSGLVTFAPAGQPALPAAKTRAAPATTSKTSTTISPKTSAKVYVTSATGRAAIRTASGLAWFTIDVNTQGVAKVHVMLPGRDVINVMHGLKARFGVNTLILNGQGLSLMLVRNGGVQHLTFKSSQFDASGMVVGGFKIV
jgi:hypothetical protein